MWHFFKNSQFSSYWKTIELGSELLSHPPGCLLISEVPESLPPGAPGCAPFPSPVLGTSHCFDLLPFPPHLSFSLAIFRDSDPSCV